MTIPPGASDPIDPTRREYVQPGDQPFAYPAAAYPPADYPGAAYPPADYPPAAAYPPPGSPPPGYPPPGSAPAGYGPPGYGQPAGAYPGQFAFDAYGRPLSDKSKVVAGILQVLLGGFGAGRFYIGDTKTAVWQLVVTIVTCGVGQVWGIIDGIMILVNGGVDAQGRVLRD